MAKNRLYGRPWTPRADIYETQEYVSIVLEAMQGIAGELGLNGTPA